MSTTTLLIVFVGCVAGAGALAIYSGVVMARSRQRPSLRVFTPPIQQVVQPVAQPLAAQTVALDAPIVTWGSKAIPSGMHMAAPARRARGSTPPPIRQQIEVADTVPAPPAHVSRSRVAPAPARPVFRPQREFTDEQPTVLVPGRAQIAGIASGAALRPRR